MKEVRGTNDFENKSGEVPKTIKPAGPCSIEEFRALVWWYWREQGRHDLAWRKTKNPYRILVSEVMLQQTQVSRVIEKYAEFLKAFPTVESLAQARLQDVLKVWSGMGYNRRAKFLKVAAEEIVKKYNGKVPRDAVTLRSLSGVGPYTASAVLVFAYNVPDTLLETNVRAAYIHHFFPTFSKKSTEAAPLFYKGAASVSKTGDKLVRAHKDMVIRDEKVGIRKDIHDGINDRDLLPLIAAAAEGQDPREWHWALMDYGSYLKKIHPNPSRRSVHHTKQSKFEGSLRQVRGAIIRELHQGPSLLTDLPFEKERIESALAGLVRDGLISKKKGKWQIV